MASLMNFFPSLCIYIGFLQMTYKAWYGKGWKAGGGRVTACSCPTCVTWPYASLRLELTAKELEINDFRHFSNHPCWTVQNPQSSAQKQATELHKRVSFNTDFFYLEESDESHQSRCQLGLCNSCAAPSWLHKFTQSHTKTQLRKNEQSLWSWNNGLLAISFTKIA